MVWPHVIWRVGSSNAAIVLINADPFELTLLASRAALVFVASC